MILTRVRPVVGSIALMAAMLLVSCNSKEPTRPTPAAPGPSDRPGQVMGPIAFVSDRDGPEQIYLATSDGSAVRRLTPGAAPAWSRDGQQLAFHNGREIYLINVDGSGLRRVGHGTSPAWSPDGRMLVFSSESGIEVVDVDGSNRRTLYDDRGYGAFDPVWAPDGRRIAFSLGTYIDFDLGLWAMNADGSDPRHIGPENAMAPAWSPDGSEIAFLTNSGISVVGADGSGPRLRVAGQASSVDWTPDGRLIFTRSPSSDWYGPGRRIVVGDGVVERQLIPDVSAPLRLGYSDSQATWQR